MAVETHSESEEVKKILKDQDIIIGAERTMKALRQGKVAQVLIASNTPDKTKKTVEHYANLSGASVRSLGLSNDELGAVCKRPFLISLLSIRK